LIAAISLGEHGAPGDHAIWWEASLSIVGSLFLIRAHVLNRYLCACCHTHLPPRAKGPQSTGPFKSSPSVPLRNLKGDAGAAPVPVVFTVRDQRR
jgi:hypothetical protein